MKDSTATNERFKALAYIGAVGTTWAFAYNAFPDATNGALVAIIALPPLAWLPLLRRR